MKRFSMMILVIVSVVAWQSVNGQAFSERNPEYVLQRADVLEIHYRYTPEFDQVVTVQPDNRVTLMNLGTIVTAGMTVSQFKVKAVEISSTRLVNPEVTVVLKEFEKPHVYVEGEVNTPGRVEIRSDISVMDAIALAGGFKSTSAQSKVLVLHRVGDQNQTVVLDLKKLISDKKLEEASVVRSGDVIYVTQNGLSKIERILHMGQFGAIYNPIR